MRPKTLSLEDAWQLYRIMGDHLQVRESDDITDVVTRIFTEVSKDNVFRALEIMYGSEFVVRPPDTLVSLMLRGLGHNRMSAFHRFVVRIGQNASDSGRA